MAHSGVVRAFGKSAKLQASRSQRQRLQVRLTLRQPSLATASKLLAGLGQAAPQPNQSE